MKLRFLCKNLICIYLVAVAMLMVTMSTSLFAEDDPIYERCASQTESPGPWCYEEEVKKAGDPALCENILKYWPKALGVHGQCYYDLTIKTKDCELCKRIQAPDLKKMCELDACK